MKNLFFITIAITILVSCSKDPMYIVEGELDGVETGMVFLQKRESGKFVKVDSTNIENGSFQINGGSVDYPSVHYLSVEGKRGYLMLFLENDRITVTGHADSIYLARAEGAPTQDMYNEYNAGLEPYYERNTTLFEGIREARQAGDDEKVTELEAERNQLFEDITGYNLDFIKSNPGSFVVPTVLRSESYGMSGEEIETIIEELNEDLLKSQIIIDLQSRIEKLKKVAIGKIAPDFTQNDTEGNPVSLSEVLGPELLLLDFWAAWCGPCRNENPNVVAVYNEFKDKGFDVLGVSLDREKDDWLKAIEEDNLTWTHLSDLKYWENEAARLYAVNAIPANFLLDSEGKILATNVRGPELRKAVAEILGE